MSKKTVMFKMPAKDASATERRPDSASPGMASGAENATSQQRDHWVEHRHELPVAERAPVSIAIAGPRPTGSRQAVFDVTAERGLHEVVLLMLALPPLLGAFWFYHAMNRIAQTWAH